MAFIISAATVDLQLNKQTKNLFSHNQAKKIVTQLQHVIVIILKFLIYNLYSLIATPQMKCILMAPSRKKTF